jgi:hypothetical protein
MSENSNDDEPKTKPVSEKRQDLYVVFTSERELRSVDQVKLKISTFTGIVMRPKIISAQIMQTLLDAIEEDTQQFL